MSRARDTADQINRVNSSAADATAITVDSSENVGIGTSSPVTFGANTHGLTLNGTASGQSITFQQGGENKGFIYNNTNDMIFASEQSGGSLTLGSNLRVSTGGSERIRIDSDGLKFNGDTAAANALNDYETGIHTSTASSSSGTPTIASTENSLSYVKIGNVVHINGQLGTVSCSGCSGDLFVSMPFTNPSLNERADYAFMNVPKGDTGAGVSHFYLQNTGGGTSFQVVAVMANGSQNGSVATLMANEGNFDLNISGTYRTS